MCQGCFSPVSLAELVYVIFHKSHSSSEVASPWNFELQLLSNYDDEHFLTHILAISLFSFGKYVF